MEKENNTEIIMQKPKSSEMGVFLKIGLFVLILIVGSSYASYKQNLQNTADFKSALDGKITDGEYSAVLNQVFTYYKEQSIIEFPYLQKLNNSNFLEGESFMSKESIKQTTDILTNCLGELDNNDEKMTRVAEGAKMVIRSSKLSQNQKTEMIVGFDKSFLDQESRDLSKNRILAMRKFYEKTLGLYEFMLANFDDYKIVTNNAGNFQPSFYSDTSITRYNQIQTDIQTLATEFQDANEKFITYSNKGFQDSGINVNSQDIEKYFVK